MRFVRRAAWAAGLAIFVPMAGVCGGHIVERVGVHWMRTHGIEVPGGCGFCGCSAAYPLAIFGLVVSVAADARTWRLSAALGTLLCASMCTLH
jgi:hypothetical protein